MSHPWLNLFGLILSASLIAGGSNDKRSPHREVLGFPGSNVDVVYFNPDPSTWKPFDLGNEPRPDRLNITLRHTGIRDSKGVNIQPAMFITAWRFPDDSMTLEIFADYMIKNTPATVSSRVMKDGRLFVEGTAFYGGYTHIFRRAFAFHNRVGIDIFCDSTDSVYPEVKTTFEAWLRSALLTPRILPTAVQPAEGHKENGENETVATTTRFHEKQKPGGSEIGDIAGIKDKGGMSVFWNASAPFFKLRVEGNDFAGYGQERAMFSADGVFFQIQSTRLSDFCPDGSLRDPEAILNAHRDWEYHYLQKISEVKCALKSWTGKLKNGSLVMYWEVIPEQSSKEGPRRHLFCTRYEAGSVITVGSVEEEKISLDQAKNLIFYAISHIEFSGEKFDIKKIHQQMSAGKP